MVIHRRRFVLPRHIRPNRRLRKYPPLAFGFRTGRNLRGHLPGKVGLPNWMQLQNLNDRGSGGFIDLLIRDEGHDLVTTGAPGMRVYGKDRERPRGDDRGNERLETQFEWAESHGGWRRKTSYDGSPYTSA